MPSRNKQQATTIPAATRSNGDDMSSIDSTLSELSARAAELQSAVDRWNNLYIAALVAAALIAVAVVYTNRGVIIRQGKLAHVQDAIIRAKDQQLRSELAAKDRELRRELNEKDHAVAGELLDKDVKIAEATGLAATTSEHTASLELEVAMQRERAAKADVRAADAEAGLLWLEKRSLPRSVNEKVFLSALEGKPKAVVEIMYAKDDSDSWQVAMFLESSLRKAGWKVERPVPIPPGNGDEPAAFAFGGGGYGVTVVRHWTRETAVEMFKESGMTGLERMRIPCRVLEDAIERSMGIDVSIDASPRNNPPEGALRIVVSPKR
jgi:hypothetical protein